MKAVLLVIIVIHGLIHLLGFVKEWNLVPVTQLSGATLFPLNKNAAHTVGTFWLAGCLLFLAAAGGYLFNKEWWWIPALAAIIVSQALIILYWKEARWGTLANAVLLAATIVGFANWKFSKTVRQEAAQIFAAVPKHQSTIVTPEMLSELPQPVQRWLNHCGIIGNEKIQTIRLKQKGWMRTKPQQDKWIEAEAEQYITVDEPAFVWKVKMNMLPLVPVTGRDKFVNGKGQMNIKLLSLINMVNSADEKIDQGALQRYLAEMGWYPSAALSPYIEWQAINTTSAKATLTYKGVSGAVLFHFDERGDMMGCSADRYMGGGKEAVLEKWEVQSKSYAEMNGIRMPVKSEATWKLKAGDFTWYKLEITEVEYNKPLLYNE